MKGLSNIFEEIRGSIKSKTFKTYKDKRKLIICKDKVRLPFTRSQSQATQRDKFKAAKDAWNQLTEEEKEEWNQQAKPYRLTGYQYFIKQKLLTPAPGYIWYKVTINNTTNSNTLTDYTVKINISNDTTFFNDCQNDKNHIRLTDGDKTTSLSYWVESWDTTNKNAVIWVKVPQIPASSNKIIYIKIDNSLTTDASSGENTFLFFDDASTDKSSSYTFVDLYNSGQPFSLLYESANHRYKITQTANDTGGLKINSVTDADIEIYHEHMYSPSINNAQIGAILRYSASGVYYIRAESYPSPDKLNIMKQATPPNTTETQLSNVDFSGNILSANTWYKIITRSYGSNLYGWIDLENKSVSATDSSYTSGSCGLFFGFDNTNHYFKNVRVRKYSSPDPTTSYIKET